jgi:hypothetical protein
MDIGKMLDSQRHLISVVPHAVNVDSYKKMRLAKDIIENLFMYLNSTGRKPWRPAPLPKQQQQMLFETFTSSVSDLVTANNYSLDPINDIDTPTVRKLTAAFGIIEETIEFLNAKSNGLEEFTDIFFFYMEEMIMANFTAKQLETMYNKKLVINLKRYEDLKAGDTAWDDRASKKEL